MIGVGFPQDLRISGADHGSTRDREGA